MSKRKDKHQIKGQGLHRTFQRGICRICGCTDENACLTTVGPCAWVDKEHTLCSACR